MTPPVKPQNTYIQHPAGDSRDNSTRLLRLYVGYRLLLSVLFFSLVQLQWAPNYLGSDDHQLFSLTIFLYTAINILTPVAFYIWRWKPGETAIFAMLLIDTAAITVMMYASGNLDGSLGYLLLVTVAASGVLQRGILALALAAIASVIVITTAVTALLSGAGDEGNVIRSGIFGILLFATAMLFIFLAKRLSLAQQLAVSESELALKLQRLNDLVINKMRTGIVVFDQHYRIQQLNERASMLVGQIDGNRLLAREDLLSKVPELVSCHREWKSNPRLQLPSYHSARSNIPLQISFSEVRGDSHNDCILFLEDARTLSQHAQQLKNNSLGQLTASIAHEIRNPLGAISHAAQLLKESELKPQDYKLVDVVLRHATRVNQLVQNIMQLSRQKTPDIDIVDIYEICQSTATQIRESQEFRYPCIEIDHGIKGLKAPFDISQLQQVLTNLLSNALHHSQKQTGLQWAEIRFGLQEDVNLPALKIYDQGCGISEDQREKIFEPFYTTEKSGTGLGLYIARGLCEINFATLSYIYNRHSRGYFQIVFSDPAKQLPGNQADGPTQ